MFDESLLKKLKLKDLGPEYLEHLEQIEALGLLPGKIFDPENTLHDIYAELKKHKNKNKKDQKRLENAEKMILDIAGLAHGRVQRSASVDPLGREVREARRRIVRGEALVEPMSTVQARIARQEILERQQSIAHMVEGNREFQLAVTRYEGHHEPLPEVKQYDAVILMCSDARDDSMLFRDFISNNILVLQIAGNPYDPKNKETSAKVDAAIRRLKEGGELVVIGHANCGAVDANAHAHDYTGGKISQHVDVLVPMIDRTHSTSEAKDDCMANCVNQAKRLENHPEVIRKDIHVSPCLFDFTNSEDRLLTYLKPGAEPKLVAELRDSSIARLKYAKQFGYDLMNQYSHAIIVSDPENLGRFSDPLVIFNARLNELFAVSFSVTTIASDSIASIEYALLKVNGVKDAPNVVIVHSVPEVAERIKKILLKQSEIIRKRTRDGELISIMQYDPKTYTVKELV